MSYRRIESVSELQILKKEKTQEKCQKAEDSISEIHSNSNFAMENEGFVNHKKRKRYVLSVDGGGVRGRICASFLKFLEEDIRKKNPEFKISNFFDLFIGTSTGAFIAAGYAILKLDSSEIEECYSIENMKRAFIPNRFCKFPCFFLPAHQAKYKGKGKTKYIQKFYGDKTIGQIDKPFIVTAYDLEGKKTVLVDSTNKEKWKNTLIREVLDGTSAAPMFFPVVTLNRIGENKEDTEKLYVIDGGVTQTTPSLTGILKAKQLWPNDEIICFSFGTGFTPSPIDGEKARNYGTYQWLSKTDLAMSQQDKHLINEHCKLAIGEKNYLRINHAINGEISPKMDKVSLKNIQDLTNFGNLWFDKFGEKCKRMMGF